MDNLIDELTRAANLCRQAEKSFSDPNISDVMRRLGDAISDFHLAWSGSYIGYQSRVYTVNFTPRKPGEQFDMEWGSEGAFSNRTRGEWAEYDFGYVYDAVLDRAGLSDLETLNTAATHTEKVFSQCKTSIIPMLDAFLTDNPDRAIENTRDSIRDMQSRVPVEKLCFPGVPKQIFSRDQLAMQQGVQSPPHIKAQAEMMSYFSTATKCAELAKHAEYAAAYLRGRLQMSGNTTAKKNGRVFIGHGRSKQWLELQTFLENRLSLQVEEFNRVSSAGIPVSDRLNQMLESSCFAFLVLTAEDIDSEGNLHARENVIHEAGLFQGRYGFKRAIVLLEEGCEVFSNISGLGQIRFRRDELKAKSEEIREVLERESII